MKIIVAIILLVALAGSSVGLRLSKDNLETYCQVSYSIIKCSNNEIEAFESDVFSNQGTNIEELLIASTRITELHPDTFFTLRGLRNLTLEYNWNLRGLPSDLFNGLARLEIFSIRGHDIRSLDTGLLDNLTGLKQLYLSYVPLGDAFTADFFKHNSNLEEIDLSYCGIKSLPVGVFDSLFKLKVLNINGNEISYIPAYVFKNNVNLETINAFFNQIDTIYPNAFYGLQNLQDLSLWSNKLQNVSYLDFVCLNLRYLNLCDNPDLPHLNNRICGNPRGIKAVWKFYMDLDEKDCPFQASSAFLYKPEIGLMIILSFWTLFFSN